MVASSSPEKKFSKVNDQMSILKILEQNISCLLDILKIYGYKPTGRELSQSIGHYEKMVESAGGDWMAVFKYKLAAYFSINMGQELPSKPFDYEDKPQHILSGSAGRFCQLLNKRELKLSFLSSISNAKKGMVRPDEKTLRRKEEQLVVDLTSPQPVEPVIVRGEEIFSKRRIIEEIHRTVDEIFQNTRVTTKDRVKAFFPSTSANYINNRKNAGSVGAILEHPLIQKHRQPGGFIPRHEYMPTLQPLFWEDDEDRDIKDIIERVEQEQWDLEVTEHEKKMFELLSEYPQGFTVKDYEKDYSRFHQKFADLWHTCLEIAEKEQNIAVPVALPESLKVRVITKGPPFRMFVLRFLQKKMHKVLKMLPVFRLIGSPTGGEVDMTSYLQQQLVNKSLGEIFLSGDYKAATDGLKSWASEAVANRLASIWKLEPLIAKLFVESLTKYDLEDKEGRLHKQTVGQLMGSITSFPILCIINAAISRMALEYHTNDRVKITLDKIPMCINGDDIAMKVSKPVIQTWRLLTGMVGLVESIGKSYYSTDFLQINSRNFQFREGKLSFTPFVNMGLVYGLKRSGLIGLSDLDDPQKTLGARYRELFKESPKELFENIHSAFIKHHKKVLDQTRLPWYIPEWLGGIGLIGYKNPSDLDRRMASEILLHWKERRPIKLGQSPGAWKTWELAEKKVDYFTVDALNEGVEEYQEVMKLECINLLFDSEISLQRLFKEPKGQSLMRKIKNNEKLWRPPKRALPEMMSLEDIAYKRKYKSLIEIGEELNLDIEYIDKEFI